jgi:ankyrin repeat protein
VLLHMQVVQGSRNLPEMESLMAAAEAGNIQLVQQLAAAGVHQRAGTVRLTALHLAARVGQHDAVRTLLAAGVNSDIDVVVHESGLGLTALHVAASRGKHQVMQVLLQAGANPAATAWTGSSEEWAGWTPLHFAAHSTARDGLQAVQLLLDAGAQVDAAGDDGSTPLLLAAKQGLTDVVQQLLAAGANIHAASALGSTPLFAAAKKGHLAVVQLLLHNDAKPWSGVGDNTALSAAAERGDVSMVQVLLEAWGQPTVTAAGLVHTAELAARHESKAALARLALELQKLYPAELLPLLEHLPAAAYPTAMAAALEGWAGALDSAEQQKQDVAQEKAAVQQLLIGVAGMAKSSWQAPVAATGLLGVTIKHLAIGIVLCLSATFLHHFLYHSATL